jgi:hypothetical protein
VERVAGGSPICHAPSTIKRSSFTRLGHPDTRRHRGLTPITSRPQQGHFAKFAKGWPKRPKCAFGRGGAMVVANSCARCAITFFTTFQLAAAKPAPGQALESVERCDQMARKARNIPTQNSTNGPRPLSVCFLGTKLGNSFVKVSINPARVHLSGPPRASKLRYRDLWTFTKRKRSTKEILCS